MKVDTYRSATGYEKFITVPSGTALEKMPFPANLDFELRKVSPHQMSENIEAGEHRLAFDAADIIQQIIEKGYAIHYATIRVTVVHT